MGNELILIDYSRDYSLALFDYPLHWVVSSYNLVLYTGDLDYLRQYYSVLVKVLDTYYPSVTDPDTELLSKGMAGTGGYGDYAFLPRTGRITYYNALYVMALNNAAELADELSESSDASRWRSRASTVSASLLKHNWDPEVGAFFDGGPCPGHDDMCPTHSQDGNSISILAGVTTTDEDDTSLSESALEYLSHAASLPYGNAFFDNDLLLTPDQRSDRFSRFSERVYAFISFFELSARFSSRSASTVSSGFEQLRRTYSAMENGAGTGTFWEGIGPDGRPYEYGFTSLAHAWSTGVTPLLTRHVLGVAPTAPGFKRWVVKPAAGAGRDVTWARGVVPTPWGDITVRWWTEDGRFEMEVNAPEDTRGEVLVPVENEDAKVLLDDWVVYDAGDANDDAVYSDGYVVLQVQGGEHKLEVV